MEDHRRVTIGTSSVRISEGVWRKCKSFLKDVSAFHAFLAGCLSGTIISHAQATSATWQKAWDGFVVHHYDAENPAPRCHAFDSIESSLTGDNPAFFDTYTSAKGVLISLAKHYEIKKGVAWGVVVGNIFALVTNVIAIRRDNTEVRRIGAFLHIFVAATFLIIGILMLSDVIFSSSVASACSVGLHGWSAERSEENVVQYYLSLLLTYAGNSWNSMPLIIAIINALVSYLLDQVFPATRRRGELSAEADGSDYVYNAGAAVFNRVRWLAGAVATPFTRAGHSGDHTQRPLMGGRDRGEDDSIA